MVTERVVTIPLLPCVSIDEAIGFYRLLGFEVTYQQARPNPYAALRRGDANLHFFGLQGLDPKKAFSTCLIVMPEVESVHKMFAEALRGAYGRVPVAGIPRISRMRKGQSRFTIVDPAGNSVIVVRSDEANDTTTPSSKPLSRLARALEQATILRDGKNDDLAAAKVLDVALSKDEPWSPIERARALAARTELAVALGDGTRAATLRDELGKLPLSNEERARFAEELNAAERLEHSLHVPASSA
ncbi:MAG: hypothetical protein K0S65_3611 [Labilithrix sp.]|nr:hypothetical protein [Labilithrix sp.]